MKYEINIPDGKFCDKCVLLGAVGEEPYCNILKDYPLFYTSRDWVVRGYKKLKKCPNKS